MDDQRKIFLCKKMQLYLNFFTRKLMWFSFSSRIFFRVSISLWFSNSSIRRWWLFSSRVSQTACNQQIPPHLGGLFRPWSPILWRTDSPCCPLNCQMGSADRPHTESFWQLRWERNESQIHGRPEEGFVAVTYTCWWGLCPMSGSAGMSADRAASHSETSSRSYLWKNV